MTDLRTQIEQMPFVTGIKATEIKQKINDYKPVHSAYYFYTLLGVCALKLNK